MRRVRSALDKAILRKFFDSVDFYSHASLFVIMAMSFIGNCLVILVMTKSAELRGSANHLIITNAVTDLVFGVLVFPSSFLMVRCTLLSLSRWPSDSFQVPFEVSLLTCQLFMLMMLLVFFVSINLQVLLSADRCWVICFPISYYKLKKTGYKKWIVMGNFFYACVLVSPPLLFDWAQKRYENDNCHLFAVFSYDFMIFFSFNISISCVLIVLFNVRMYCKI
jgi:7 transmembrane receptor (rhodopsin family)